MRRSRRPSDATTRSSRNLQVAAARLETGESFDPNPQPAPRTERQVFVKNSTTEPRSDASSRRSKTATKSREEEKLADWLGGRDSNPDNVVQSHVSYRWTTSQYQPETPVAQEPSIIANRNHDGQAHPAGTRTPNRRSTSALTVVVRGIHVRKFALPGHESAINVILD